MLIDFQNYFWDSESYTLHWPRTLVSEVDLEFLIFLLLPPGCGIASYTTGQFSRIQKISQYSVFRLRGFIFIECYVKNSKASAFHMSKVQVQVICFRAIQIQFIL